MSEQFRVQPVTRYDGAQYPGPEPALEEDQVEDGPHLAVFLFSILLSLGLALGLIGCYTRSDYSPGDPEPPTPDGGPDPDCLPDELRCLDGVSLERCEEGSWQPQSCDVHCANTYGPEYYSGGCNASIEDPCLCIHDDILDGAAPMCSPEDISCSDWNTVVFCDELGGYASRDCHELCQEIHGPEYGSRGCDAAADDPCQCGWDIIDGDGVACMPEDLYCADEHTVAICEHEWYSEHDCNELCRETHGSESNSAGCDAEVDDPCQCFTPEAGSGGE